MLPIAMLCYSGPIDCPTFPTTTSRVNGGAQWLNAFAVTIPGLTAIWVQPFDAVAMMDFIIFLIVSTITFVFVCAVAKYSCPSFGFSFLRIRWDVEVGELESEIRYWRHSGSSAT